jgi:hypothetical protein
MDGLKTLCCLFKARLQRGGLDTWLGSRVQQPAAEGGCTLYQHLTCLCKTDANCRHKTAAD